MADIPEHLLRRSAERRKAARAARPARKASAAAERRARGARRREAPADAAEAAAAAAAAARSDRRRGHRATRAAIPAHLLERSKRRKAALGRRRGGAAAAAAAAAAATATATAVDGRAGARPATGPGRAHPAAAHRRQVGLDPADRAEAQDKVHIWPHLLVIEFAVDPRRDRGVAHLLGHGAGTAARLADFNKTPNPSKAPWYFLGLQELLTMFHPMVAGVTIPGMGLAC